MNYQQADEYLGKKLNRPIGSGRATRLVRNSGVPGDKIHLKLHDTYVITWYADGRIELNSGGWRTVTTKARINEFVGGGYSISQSKGQWYLTRYQDNEFKTLVLFEDGLIIHPDDAITGGSPIEQEKENIKLRKQVNKYATVYIAAFKAGDVPAPSAGDCWYCSLRGEDGRTLGELTSNSHILEHIKENYFVPSLLQRAFETLPHSEAMGWALAKAWSGQEQANSLYTPDFVYDQLKKTLARYILRQVGQAA